MELFNFQIEEVQVFFLILARTLGVVALAPIFGAPVVHRIVKVGLALFITILLFPVVPIDGVVIPDGLGQLAIGLLGELAVGIIVGFIARVCLIAVEMGAQVVSYQMGFAIANVLDPQSNSQMSAISLFQNMTAVLIFLAIDAHHWLLEALAESFKAVKPLSVVVPKEVGLMGVNIMQNLFVAAVKIAAPGIVVLLMVSLLMGIIARTVPQVNILIVGLPLKIGIGLIVIGASMLHFSNEVVKLLIRMRFDISTAIRFLGG
ncbi:flagellar biosynthetic protein FliR [bacterium]|nr:flagellar biosynthetic protein FliR [bacterium]